MEEPISIAKNVLRAEADAILNLCSKLDEAAFQKSVDIILSHKGRVLVLGVGKSGHIGRKIAATLASTGQPSFFIHATEAVHGDLGMMVPGDVCLLLSHSGNTSELLQTIYSIKRMGLPIIAITGNEDSKLAQYADVVLNTCVQEEACPLNLAPTTSTTVTLAYGDALAIALLKVRGFSEEQFAMCHPAGSLGKRLLMKVSDVMVSKDLPVNQEQDTFHQALDMMTKGRQGVTIITDAEGKCAGILTDGDLRRTLERFDKVSDIVLEKVYTKNPKTIQEAALAVEALRKMQENKITSLVVVGENKQVIGLIHIHHLLEQGFY